MHSSFFPGAVTAAGLPLLTNMAIAQMPAPLAGPV